MWKYSEKLMDHFMNPRNSGQLPDPDGHSEIGSPQCGDAMTLDIRVDDDNRIADIRFMTFGCAGAIAAASALTEIARGKTLEEALEITNDRIVEFLGGMPEEKYHCSVMGHEALSAAVSNFRHRSDNVAEHLKAIISEMPEDLAEAAGNGGISITHVHPERVHVRLAGGDSISVITILEREMRKRTGKAVKVSVTE
ncbi:MAG: iron-sulfur cluster assembly scaffold protein [Candidatus Aegiribacteria sp.]|nr:iron-sulfur cluster assembly scaffold protein [Candidatus Aegiribacteria sp.]